MTLDLGLTLAALALVDSLSIGTLLIPLFFLVAPGRVRSGRVLLYLATIAVFYFLVGLALTAGADALLSEFAEVLRSPGGRWTQLVLGVGLLAGSFWIDRKRPEGEERPPGRLARLRDRAMGDGSPTLVVALALGAGLVELATMLPYLGAVGMITAAGLPPQLWVGVLAVYCLVMIAPALLLLTARVVARRFVEPPLAKFAAWLEKNSAENTAWIVGIVGFLLARDAASTLGLFS